MAVAGMSPGDPYPVGPATERGKDELGTHSCGAWHPDYPEVGGVLKAAHPGQICRAIAAPVTKKSSDFRLPIVHGSLLITIRQLQFDLSSPYHISHILDGINHRHNLAFSESL